METVIYSEAFASFMSFADISARFYMKINDKIYSMDESGNIRLHNARTFIDSNPLLENNEQDKTAMVRFVINDNYPITKIFDNVEYTTKPTNSAIPTLVTFKTDRQISDNLDTSTIQFREDTYKFAIPRAKYVSGVEQTDLFRQRMRGKYLVCDYSFDASSVDGNKRFSIPYIKTTYRISNI